MNRNDPIQPTEPAPRSSDQDHQTALLSLVGSVERVTYHNEQNGYTVLRLQIPGRGEPVTVVGNFSAVSPGESLRVTGWWTTHPQYGDQFKMADYAITRPATVAGIQKYLGSGLIKGVGPITARRIVEHFKEKTLEVIEGDISRLGEVYGIGFRTADQIARNLGMAPDAEERLRAGLQHTLMRASEEGHCYLPAGDLIERSAEALEVEDRAKLEASLERALDDGLLKVEENGGERAVYLPPLWQSERGVARRLGALVEEPLRVDANRVESWLDRFAAKRGVALSEEQRRAVHLAARSRVMILTGGPGTGKTFTLRTMVELFYAMRKTVALASPTGRAAQRLSEVTGREAKTIHRLLEFDPAAMRFKRNDVWPLEADVVIVDEASMIDIVLANSLIKAIDEGSSVILVGDADQLPSAGPGAFLQDLISSGVAPVARLTQIFRQAAHSLIVQNAHQINRGEFPRLVKPGEGKSDCYFIEAEEPDEVVRLIVNSVSKSLPSRFGYDPLKDIQTLSPMNRGRVGAGRLNGVLQAALNPQSPDAPGKAEAVRGDRTLRVGDKVIQRVNNYRLEVFNGDMGTIEAMDLEDQMIAVRFADRVVEYDFAESLELSHGFAVTINKSQGSEYPAVVIPLHTQHYLMLSRNLLYTALTRAKKTVVMIRMTQAIGMAMNNLEATRRFTGLARELKG